MASNEKAQESDIWDVIMFEAQCAKCGSVVDTCDGTYMKVNGKRVFVCNRCNPPPKREEKPQPKSKAILEKEADCSAMKRVLIDLMSGVEGDKWGRIKDIADTLGWTFRKTNEILRFLVFNDRRNRFPQEETEVLIREQLVERYLYHNIDSTLRHQTSKGKSKISDPASGTHDNQQQLPTNTAHKLLGHRVKILEKNQALRAQGSCRQQGSILFANGFDVKRRA